MTTLSACEGQKWLKSLILIRIPKLAQIHRNLKPSVAHVRNVEVKVNSNQSHQPHQLQRLDVVIIANQFESLHGPCKDKCPGQID